MATSEIALYNLALDTVGSRHRVSLPSEQSREAETCNLWYPNIRDQVLASAPWPEATKMERLALLAEQDADGDESWASGDPRPDLANTYALPSDFLHPQYTTNYARFTIQSYGSENKALMMAGETPILVYTFRQTKVSVWSPLLQGAVVAALAARICIPMTGKTSRAKLLIEEANAAIMQAREVSANYADERIESNPDWIAMRGYSGSTAQTRFFYPAGQLLSANVG